MKDIVSLLLTTTCLAVAGLGIYFFSSNADENTSSKQKTDKKRTSISGGKKYNDVEDYLDSDNNDIDIDNDIDNNSQIDDNEVVEYNYKSKPKTNNKTKKSKGKFTSSKKRYY